MRSERIIFFILIVSTVLAYIFTNPYIQNNLNTTIIPIKNKEPINVQINNELTDIKRVELLSDEVKKNTFTAKNYNFSIDYPAILGDIETYDFFNDISGKHFKEEGFVFRALTNNEYFSVIIGEMNEDMISQGVNIETINYLNKSNENFDIKINLQNENDELFSINSFIKNKFSENGYPSILISAQSIPNAKIPEYTAILQVMIDSIKTDSV